MLRVLPAMCVENAKSHIQVTEVQFLEKFSHYGLQQTQTSRKLNQAAGDMHIVLHRCTVLCKELLAFASADDVVDLPGRALRC